jgi:hypothetical protein
VEFDQDVKEIVVEAGGVQLQCASEVVPVFGRPTPMRWNRRAGRAADIPPLPTNGRD